MTATTSDVQARVRALREETIAAIEQRDLLATNARRALIAAWEAGRICRTGCADALTGWGLAPPPGQVTMSARGQMSYARMHTDEDEARAQALDHVPEELYRLLPEATIWPWRSADVALISGEDHHPEEHPYRITVQVTLRLPVTATSQAASIEIAEATVNARLSELADAGITLTGLVWEVYDGPDDLIHAVDTAVQPATVRLPDVGDELTAATEARDAAIGALANLKRAIRRRAIRALVDDELGGEYEETAERVERFLRDLGLAGLPRAHHVMAAVDLNLGVGAASSTEAYRAVSETMRTITAGHVGSLPWTAWGYPAAESAVPDGELWRIAWQHEFEFRLRENLVEAGDAAVAGEALARTAITGALAGIDHDLVRVTVTVQGFGIDEHLDPDTD